MATKSSFFAEDTVSLKQDPTIIAIVESAWRDVDSGGFGRPSDWIVHNGVSASAVRQCIRDSQPPKGHVTITFTLPDIGCALIKEEDLVLIDRALTVGDVVKRQPTDIQSGMVLKASENCLIEPIYNDLPFTGHKPWPYKSEENRLLVPAEDLTQIDLEDGDRIIYRDWIGEVSDTTQEVTIRLGNGSIVKVDDPEKLEVPDHISMKFANGERQDLVTILKQSRVKRNQATVQNKDDLAPPVQFWPGQTVFTTKANLRLGVWKVGRYTPSEPPKGVVVDVRVNSLQVDWIATKLFDPSRTTLSPPDETIEWPELDEVRQYNSNNLTSSNGLSSNELGTRVMNDIVAGDTVRLREISGAAVKYSEESPQSSETGVLRRIPRTMTDGFDMNTFFVKETTTTVRIQWQDGSITQELAVDLFPYLNVDDHDLWVGEIVSMKSAEICDDNELVHLKKVGVVQNVDAQERTAQRAPRYFFSGADLGPLSQEQTSVPLYDIMAYQALSKRRGDLVVLAPNATSQALHTAVDIIERSNNGHIPQLPDLRDTDPTPDPQNILSSTEVRWFGEVVDLTLNGDLIIRLGALENVEDIRVPIQRVNVAIGGDDPDGFDTDGGEDILSYGSMDDDSDEWDSNFDDEDIVEETFYEGGERIDDDGGEDAWMTDGTDEGDNQPPKSASPEDGPPFNDVNMTHDSGFEGSELIGDGEVNGEALKSLEEQQTDNLPGRPPSDMQLNTEKDLIPSKIIPRFGLMAYPSMPPPFEILDHSPAFHHYLSSTVSLSSSFLRQIRREHAILSSSLPEGIWVRTWSERLDLMQVLILGPRGTPYALAPFLFDFHFKADYPLSAPQTHFHSWTNGVGRINPNLYEDGKVCLSVLGTWHQNEEGEGWNREKSSLLQVLVSLLGLVLVEQPYYNEAGFDTLVGAEETRVPARIYAEKALCLSKGFVAHALRHGCGALSNVAEWLYRDPKGPKLITNVVEDMQEVLARKKDGNTEGGSEEGQEVKPLSAGAEALLRRFLPTLEGIAKGVTS